METAMQIFNSLKDNADLILKGLGGLYLFLLLVVTITPTKKDDEILGKAYGIVHKITGFLKVKK